MNHNLYKGIVFNFDGSLGACSITWLSCDIDSYSNVTVDLVPDDRGLDKKPIPAQIRINR